MNEDLESNDFLVSLPVIKTAWASKRLFKDFGSPFSNWEASCRSGTPQLGIRCHQIFLRGRVLSSVRAEPCAGPCVTLRRPITRRLRSPTLAAPPSFGRPRPHYSTTAVCPYSFAIWTNHSSPVAEGARPPAATFYIFFLEKAWGNL